MFSPEKKDGIGRRATTFDFLVFSFDVERSDQPMKFEYTDASIAPGVTYHYKLEAIDVTGKNHFIVKASATPRAAPTADKPHGESSPAKIADQSPAHVVYSPLPDLKNP